jgi:hypothetical protein
MHPPSTPHSDVVELVLKALDSLTAEERRRVLSALIEAAAIVPGAATSARAAIPPALSPQGWFSPGLKSSASASVLPVRLPTEQLERLRSWCTDHGFSMAVVIRGLVDRFLDDQVQRP